MLFVSLNIMAFDQHIPEIIREILENRAQTYRQLGEGYDASRDKRLDRERETEENLEEGGVDNNFANYQSPAIENQDAI